MKLAKKYSLNKRQQSQTQAFGAKKTKLLLIAGFAACFGFSHFAVAETVGQASTDSTVSAPGGVGTVENRPDVAPDILVSQATDALLLRINTATAEDKALGLSFYEHLVEQTVGPFVDFEKIARLVMGRSVYEEATAEQRVAFVEAFKRSLITTYAKGISTYDDQSITVSPYQGIQTKNGISRAKVELQIQPKGGKPFPIIYSMFQDEARGWLLENMHLDGVNVGSTFRNQFKQSLKDNGADIDRVISSWGASS